MDEILRVDHVSKNFAGLKAVDDLSFTVKKRQIHTLIGPNGAGKTTTVNLITSVIKNDTGHIYFDGEEITGTKPHKIAQMGLGRTFQNIKLFGEMTVIENLMVGNVKNTTQSLPDFLWNLKRAKQEEEAMRAKAEGILTQLDLLKYKDTMVNSLPYGLRKMTELGRTLASDPKMILLDEPAAGLNPSERQDFMVKMKQIYDTGIDFFLIEHNMDIVMNISDYITVINFGAKIAEGTPEEIMNNPEVISAYLGERFKVKQEGV